VAEWDPDLVWKDAGKITLLGFNSPPVKLLSIRYTNYAIPAPSRVGGVVQNLLKTECQ
jgi:hypothetical protein